MTSKFSAFSSVVFRASQSKDLFQMSWLLDFLYFLHRIKSLTWCQKWDFLKHIGGIFYIVDLILQLTYIRAKGTCAFTAAYIVTRTVTLCSFI